MKLTIIAVATAFLLAGTAGHAQTHLPGSPAARQTTGDPMIKEPTAEQLRRSGGNTTGRSISQTDPVNGRLGGTAESQQAPSGSDSSGGK